MNTLFRTLVALMLFVPTLAQAQTTFFSETFDGYGTEAQTLTALRAKYACSYSQSIAFGNGAAQDLDTAQKFAGTYALKQNYTGSQYDPIPQGGGSCEFDFYGNDSLRKDVWITWYHYLGSNWQTSGGGGVGGVATKGLYMYMKSLSTGQVNGWVFHYFYGGNQLTMSAQGIKDHRGPNGPGTGTSIPYDTENMWQNVQSYEQPRNRWVCYEANYKLNDPGQSNGQYLLYSTDMTQGGQAVLRASHTGREFVGTTPQDRMPSDARWFRFKFYRQDGSGDMWYDNASVTSQRIGCNGTPPPPPPPPPVDSTPPTQPGTPSCTPGETSAACTWAASSDANNPITYSLQYRVGSNNFTTGATSTSTSANLTGLALNTAYDARVIATDPAGNPSAASATGTFTTTAGGGSGGLISVDAVSNSDSTATAVSSRTWSHTVGSTADTLAVCAIARDSASETPVTVSGVTFKGTALTKVRHDTRTSGTERFRTELWYLVGPEPGAGNIVATWTGTPSHFAVGSAVSLSGVSTASPIDAHTGGTGAAADVSTEITTVANDSLVLDCAFGGADAGLAVGGAQTSRTARTVPFVGQPGLFDSVGVSTAQQAVAGAKTMTWNQGGASNFAQSVISFAAEVTTPTVQPTITGLSLDATGATVTHGATTATQIRVVEGNNDKGTISSVLEPIASFPAGRYTKTWRDGLSYVCLFPINASGVENPDPDGYRCGSLVGIVGALDTDPPVISNCQPTSALPHGTTARNWSCLIDKPAVGKWGTSDVDYASLPNTADIAALTISGAVTGLTNGSTTQVYVGAASVDALGDEHATVANTTVTIEVAAAPAADTTRPSDVADLAATNLGQVAELNWSAATDNVGVVGYQVYQSTGACSTYTVAGNPVTTTSTLINLAAATVHCWKVKALDAANNDSLNFSNVATFTTSGIIDFERPSTMSNLRVANRYSASVLLQWDIGTDNFGTPKALIEQCTVVSGTSCENFETAKTEIVDRTLKIDLTPSTTYCWRGKHSDNSGNVSLVYSNAVCGQTAALGAITSPLIPTYTPRIPATGRILRPIP